MNADTIQGHLTQLLGSAEEHWGRLIHDPHHVHHGQQARNIGRIQCEYGKAREQAHRCSQQYLQTHPHLHG